MIELIKKYKEIILYLIFGVITTLINIIVFYIMTELLNINYIPSNIVAWILSVLFAFITNKLYVFESKNKNKIEIRNELTTFFGFRLLSLGIDTACMFLLISILGLGGLVSKILVNVLIIIINYVFSKLIIFKK